MRLAKLMHSSESMTQDALIELHEPAPDVISGALGEMYAEDIESLSNKVENALIDTATLNEIADKLEACSDVTLPTMEFTSIAVEAMNHRLGINTKIDLINKTPTEARTIVLESIAESISRAWKALIAAIKRIWQMTKDFFKNAFGSDARLDKVIESTEQEVDECNPPNPDEVAPEEPESETEPVTTDIHRTDYSKPVINRIRSAPNIAGKRPQMFSNVYCDHLQVGLNNEVGAKVLVPALAELNVYLHKDLPQVVDQVAEIIKEICAKLVDNNFIISGLTHGPLPHPGVEVRSDKTFVAVPGAESFVSPCFPGNKGILFTATNPELFKQSQIELKDTTDYYFHIRTHSRPTNANGDKRADVLTKNEMLLVTSVVKALKNHKLEFLKHINKVIDDVSKVVDETATKAASVGAPPDCTSGVIHLNTQLTDLGRKVDTYLVNLITLSLEYVKVSTQMNNRRNRKKQ